MKNLIHIRTALLLVLVFVAIQTGAATFDFTADSIKENISYAITRPISIRSGDLVDPPGLIKPTSFPLTCYDYMGTITFSSAYRFVTSYTKTDPTGKGKVNSDSNERMYVCSIPLVADLDEDGYPELIAVGVPDGYNESLLPWARYKYLYIYNGQTGEKLAKLLFDSGHPNSYARHSNDGYHGSPSIIALVDSDGDRKIEVIAAFPDYSSGTFAYTNRLVSYVLTPTKSGATTTGYTMALNSNWPSTPPQYNTGANTHYSRPIPQIVDINGDGEPEVVVYNKIYSAKTGRLKVTLETLGGTGTDAAYAYVGSAIPYDHSEDGYINFSCIYDLDLDGNYDIAAGGKVYYNIDVDVDVDNTGTFSKIDGLAATVKDGRTGIADIDGDGIPDIVVVNRNSSTSSLEIYVWDPGFLETDEGGNVVKKTPPFTPSLKAHRSLSFAQASDGTNSHVYIGDIDGREQVYNGKTYRLPEIAVLAGQLTYNIPIHPNVTNMGIPTDGNSGTGSKNTGNKGVLAAFTWDPADASNRLKLSFVLGHNDKSGNTGFTMFDFDNDGRMEICYHDEYDLRIIKASRPYITWKETAQDVILFSKRSLSLTGFEYPVIADIDNDASAEVIVLGRDDHEGDNYPYGFIYALGNGTGDKFAPALPVWNQFMYDPFKINPDLTTPIRPAPNRLAYKYNRRVTQDGTEKIIRDYQPYNNTIGQIFYYEAAEESDGNYMEPIVFLTQAYIASGTDPVISKRPKIVVGGTNYIEITIGNNTNAETDISTQTPIAIYETNVSAASYVTTVPLANVIDVQTGSALNKAIKAGEEYTIRIPIPSSHSAYSAYYVRLGDDSKIVGGNWEWHFGTNNGGEGPGDDYSNPPANASQGIGISSRAYRDCDWRDQAVKAALVSLNPDAVTVQQYGTVSIDIFANDEFPLDLPTDQKLVQNVVGSYPVAGSIQFANNKIIYTHDARAPLPNNVDSFRYVISYKPTGGVLTTYTAFVYIYVLEAESGGFAACYGTTLATELIENPVGIRFLWNVNPNSSDIYPDDYNGGTGSDADSLTINFGSVTTPKTYKVKPLLTFYNNDRIDFAPGNLTIGVLGGGVGDNAVFRWTGEINTNWNDPRNWVEVKNSTETPVLFVPTTCVDVIIPSGLKNYPMLTAPAACADITMKDRAMIAGIHHLTYSNAQVELTLNAAERDRFIMWSTPLKSIYSGDYHFKDATDNPKWGDVYMNFFQHASPDGSSLTGVANSFTATFGNVGVSLPLGKAFNLKMTSTTVNKDKPFTFPQTAPTYTDAITPISTTYNVPRTLGDRFILDKNDGNPHALPVFNDVDGSSLAQVVNPYMAYLNVESFLQGNQSYLSTLGYAIWDGSTSSFTPHAAIEDIDKRFEITTAPSMTDPSGFIPPLQSFFVQKKGTAPLGTDAITISALWTTTTPGSPYKLRADAPETNILRIKAVQDKQVSYAVLYYNENTSPAYNSKEDMHKLFYQLEENVIPLEVYTFAPTREVLAINSSSDFSKNVPLGLRTDKAGSVTLEFSGMATFGHNVYLIDHAQNNKETDLQKSPTYTFTVTKKSAGDKVIELNDRFSLRTTYTGIGLDNEATGTTDVSVSSRDGYIYIQSPSPVSSLQVYSLTGALVYSSADRLYYYHIKTDGQQAYIVKIKMNGQYIMKKTFVK